MAVEGDGKDTANHIVSDANSPQSHKSKQHSLRKLKYKQFSRKQIGLGLMFLVFLGLLVFFIFRYQSQQDQIKRLSNPQALAQEEQQQLVTKVGKLTDLPKNENPTVATVSDVNKLKDQTFFANAQNGDKVLIYSQSKQAILYRPSTNKIIQISSVNLGNQ
jgi:hypothetical protein